MDADKLKDLKKKQSDLRRKIRQAEKLSGNTRYEDHRDDAADRSREKSQEGREIGSLPKVINPARKTSGLGSLLLFAKSYFPSRFPLPFSTPHIAAIEKLERITNEGGRFALAMPRGSGKTTIATVAALRAVLYGLRRFVVIVSATERHAGAFLKQLQAELETNDLLLDDFPEACFPIRKLERIHNRAKGQTYQGEPTRIEWTADGIALPTIKGEASSGAIIRVAGLTGAIRGLNVLVDGKPLRPDLVILDDCQTRESSKSPTQTSDRESITTDDILGLAGPTTEISAAMLCTVIYSGDLSERFLSSEKHPEWNGQRTKMIESFPENMDLWQQYAEIRRDSFRNGTEGRTGTEFYAQRLDEMRKGAVVPWMERKKPDEIDGLQSAMNMFFDNRRGFFAEYQNSPLTDDRASGAKELHADGIASRLTGTERYLVPNECSHVTAFVDCGLHLHWWCVVAWTNAGAGVVIDYGQWPRQTRSVFSANDPKPSLGDKYPGTTEEQRVYAGLVGLGDEVLKKTYHKQGGGEMRIDVALIDSGWKPEPVYKFARQFVGCTVYPSKGIARTTTARGVGEWKPRPGERKGHHWRMTQGEIGRTRAIQFDPDIWKTALFSWLTIPLGGSQGVALWGKHASTHEMFSNHVAAEYSEPVEIRGTRFDKWMLRVDRPDNHWLDTLVGCAVAASVSGVMWSVSDHPEEPPEPRPKLRYADKIAQRERESVTGKPAAQSVPSSSPAIVANEANGQQQPLTPAPKKKLRYADVMREREQRKRGGG